MSAGQTVTAEDVAAYLRATDQHVLSGVRAGVADLLEGGSGERLARELEAVYALPLAWVFLEALTRTWLASDEPVLRRCGELLDAARGDLWDGGLDGLQ